MPKIHQILSIVRLLTRMKLWRFIQNTYCGTRVNMDRLTIHSLCLFIVIGRCYPDSVTEMGAEEGYVMELHHVTTEDNYILGFHRIPSRKPAAKTVFLMHSLLNSGADYLLFGPKYSLGYILADEGHDVWMGSARGTQFSRSHAVLDADSPTFWDFSFHEIGKYDLPAMIDYALTTTNQSVLHYVGHSQGGTVFFVMLDQRPEYNAKIASMHSMASGVFLGDFSALPGWAQHYAFIKDVAESMNFYELSRDNGTLKKLLPLLLNICKPKTLQQVICANFYFWLSGTIPPLLTIRASSNFLGNTPSGASLKQLVHFFQIILTDKFHQYDYNTTRNQEIYGQASPPEYNLSNVTADIYPMYGPSDIFTPATGMRKMIKELGRCVKEVYFIPEMKHVGFIYSRYAKKYVYRHILKDIRKYTNV